MRDVSVSVSEKLLQLTVKHVLPDTTSGPQHADAIRHHGQLSTELHNFAARFHAGQKWPSMMRPELQAPDPKIKVSLENHDLWNRFHKLGTEMIITKPGR